LLTLLPASARDRIGGDASWLGGGTRALAIAARAWLREPSWAPWERAAAFERECGAVRRELAIGGTFDAKHPAPIAAELTRLRERLGAYLDVVSWGMVFAYVFYHLLQEVTRRWAPGCDTELAALTVGLPGVASLEAHRELHALTPLLLGDPALRSALASGRTDAALVLASNAGAAGGAFRAFLVRHGHRLTGRDLSCPTWRESQGMVVELAASDRDGHAAIDPVMAAERRARSTAAMDHALGGGPAGAARRAVFHLVLAAAQRYYALRENMRYHADFFLARMRALALAAGAEIAAAGHLTAVNDVFWLDQGELERALGGDPAAAAPASERRASWSRDAAAPPPETLDDAGETAGTPAVVTPVLKGEAGAPGHCRGTARLVRSPDDFERVGSGDVLVAVYTDPGWTPVLERAAGLILEAGGLLSHGAIVARELGIPALVGVAGAMHTIRDGDVIDVDAASGRATITRG
jgi:pyruvate,water dikinase